MVIPYRDRYKSFVRAVEEEINNCLTKELLKEDGEAREDINMSR